MAVRVAPENSAYAEFSPAPALALTLPFERLTSADAARELHNAGLNVFPLPLGQKAGVRWRPLTFTRLLAADLPDVFAGRCNLAVMTGRTSGGLFVLDCESEPAFVDTVSAIRARAIPLWAVRTARGGHVYLRCADGELLSIPPGRIPDIEVRGRGGYVLAPPSVHPSGVLYAWLAREGAAPPAVSPAAIDFLLDASGQPVALQAAGKRRSSRLGSAARDYLTHGHAIPDGQRHNALLAACRDYRLAGYGRAEMERDLAPLAQASGLPRDEVAAVVDWVMERVEPQTNRRARALPNPDAFDWPGRTGRTDCAVFTAMVSRAQQASNEHGVWRASWRELMALAGIEKRTLRFALSRLQARELVIRAAGVDRASGAALWRFGPAAAGKGRDDLSTPSRAKYAEMTPTTILSSDTTNGGHLRTFSPAERRIFDAVMRSTAPLRTARDIAAAAGLTEQHVRRALRTDAPLRTTGAIVKRGGNWRAVDPDPVAMQARVDRDEHKRRRIKRQTSDERARRAAQRLIEGRYRGKW